MVASASVVAWMLIWFIFNPSMDKYSQQNVGWNNSSIPKLSFTKHGLSGQLCDLFMVYGILLTYVTTYTRNLSNCYGTVPVQWHGFPNIYGIDVPWNARNVVLQDGSDISVVVTGGW